MEVRVMTKARLKSLSAARLSAPNLRERQGAASGYNRVVNTMADDFLRGGPRKAKTAKKAWQLPERGHDAGSKGSSPLDSKRVLAKPLSGPRDMEAYLLNR
jgi:hypothetical protein